MTWVHLSVEIRRLDCLDLLVQISEQMAGFFVAVSFPPSFPFLCAYSQTGDGLVCDGRPHIAFYLRFEMNIMQPDEIDVQLPPPNLCLTSRLSCCIDLRLT
jgi:hypothetical protein